MPKIYYETKNEPAFELEQSEDLIAVRTRSGRSLTRSAGPVAQPISSELDDGVLAVAYPEVGVEVYRIPTGRHARSVSERKSALRAHLMYSLPAGSWSIRLPKSPCCIPKYFHQIHKYRRSR